MENVFTVIKVERCPNKHVSAVQSGDNVVLTGSLHEDVKARVPATLKLSESVIDGEHLYKAELTFKVKKQLHDISKVKNFSYRITISNGEQFLMGVGMSNHPSPVTTMSRTMGSVTADQMCNYKVTLEDCVPLPKII